MSTIAALLCVLLCAAPGARAAPAALSFVGGASGVGTGGMFTEPSDVAVYTGGTASTRDDRIFVVEAAGGRNSRVQRLDAAGNFELMWGRDVVRAGVKGDTGAGYEVCRAVVSGARGCKSAPAGTAEGELSKPTAVAVDQATGHVYVSDHGNRRVQAFEPDGDFVRAWGWGVDTGAPRFERCSSSCRAGRVGGREGDGNAGQLVASPNGAIAIAPLGSRHVFVGDGGNHRVFEFEPDGGFVRAWGWGVDTGAPRFEVCTTRSGCRAGRAVGPAATDSWPRNIAIDGDGIVYGFGFPDSYDVVRFDSDPAPRPPSAGGALLDALGSRRVLTNARTFALEIAPATGSLTLVRNPFGPSVVEEVRQPGADLAPGSSPRPQLVEISRLGFAGSVNGVGISGSTGYAYMAIGTRLHSQELRSIFTTCASRRGPRPCHGLVVLAADTGPAEAVLTPPYRVGRSTVAGGVVRTDGVARYRFQISKDGTSWSGASPPRLVAGPRAVHVHTRLTETPTSAHRIRLVVRQHGPDGDLLTASDESFVVPTQGFVARR